MERFWSKVNKTEGCWEWTGALKGNGYGQFFIRRPLSPVYAHRLSWELTRGAIPDGLHIDHKCRNRKCVNPDHLEPVTQAENNIRSQRVRKATYSARTRCNQGHLWTTDNSYFNKRGSRECKTCVKQRANEYYRRKVGKQNGL